MLIYAVLKKTVRSPEVCEFLNCIKNHRLSQVLVVIKMILQAESNTQGFH